MARRGRVKPRAGEHACERCGCTESHACPGGCSWDAAALVSGRHLCSRCAALRWFAVVIYVEAEDTVGATEAVLDRCANPEAFQRDVSLGDHVKIRPARRRELE